MMEVWGDGTDEGGQRRKLYHRHLMFVFGPAHVTGPSHDLPEAAALQPDWLQGSSLNLGMDRYHHQQMTWTRLTDGPGEGGGSELAHLGQVNFKPLDQDLPHVLHLRVHIQDPKRRPGTEARARRLERDRQLRKADRRWRRAHRPATNAGPAQPPFPPPEELRRPACPPPPPPPPPGEPGSSRDGSQPGTHARSSGQKRPRTAAPSPWRDEIAQSTVPVKKNRCPVAPW